MQLPPVRLGGGHELRIVGQQLVQAAREIEARVERLGQQLDPGGRDHAAAVGDADDQRPRAGGHRLRRASCPASRDRPCSPGGASGRSHQSGRQSRCPAPSWPRAGRRASPRNKRYGGSIIRFLARLTALRPASLAYRPAGSNRRAIGARSRPKPKRLNLARTKRVRAPRRRCWNSGPGADKLNADRHAAPWTRGQAGGPAPRQRRGNQGGCIFASWNAFGRRIGPRRAALRARLRVRTSRSTG